MKTLPSDVVEQVIGLHDLVRRAGARYRVYALVTQDQSVMAALARYLREGLDGIVLDALDHSLLGDDVIVVDPVTLVDWVSKHLAAAAPACLLHVDAILSTWRTPLDHRVWWGQAASIQRNAPLFIPTARHEITEVAVWGRAPRPLWVEDTRVDIWTPRNSTQYRDLSQE